MTIPQLISSVGWFLLIAGLACGILHTVNLAVPGVDFLVSTSQFGLWPYLGIVPVTVVGLAFAIIGFFAEWLEEWWINKDR
jgi:hypothetical protein